MLPLILDAQKVAIGLVGRDRQAMRRLALLEAAGASDVRVFSDQPSADLAEAVGDGLIRRFPGDAELHELAVLFIADLGPDEALHLADQARSCGTLVNTEDQAEACDFHVPAAVRRGDLLLTASTGGKSPALARVVKAHLEAQFDENWAGYTEEISELRQSWRAQGASPSDVTERTRSHIEQKGWLAK